MAEFVDDKLKEMRARLKELAPLAAEFHRLEAVEAAATAALGAITETVSPPAAAPARRTRPTRRATTSAKRTTAKRAPATTTTTATTSRGHGRPTGTGTRAAQALKIVQSKPGITVPEIAQQMGIAQNYLYRVLPGLAEEGKIVKSGTGWHPAGTLEGTRAMRNGEMAGVS